MFEVLNEMLIGELDRRNFRIDAQRDYVIID